MILKILETVDASAAAGVDRPVGRVAHTAGDGQAADCDVLQRTVVAVVDVQHA